ncbi:monooxygenase [Burkholderia anthina]|uniref:monooxygenase n=1 Tax=Burkholderia anthina TaxID=179879 RepID=UPI00158F20B9|nr:monooxygenase [Burkholderia anthina]
MQANEYLDINEVAEFFNMKAQSVRARLWRTGSFWGIAPSKAPNGRNLFPADAVRSLVRERGEG